MGGFLVALSPLANEVRKLCGDIPLFTAVVLSTALFYFMASFLLLRLNLGSFITAASLLLR